MKFPKHLRVRLRSAFTNAALLMVSFAMAVIAAELLVRLLIPQQLIIIRPDIWQPADSVGWLVSPNVNTKINTGERTVTVRTDGDGFRIGAVGRRHGRKRVLVMGDSFMQALQVEHEESTAGRLETLLDERLGEPVAVRNSGVTAWGPNQYRIRTRQLLERDSFDLVIVAFYVGNDIVRMRKESIPPRAPVQRYHLRLPQGLSARNLVDALVRPINDAVEERSHLFVFAKTRLQTLRMAVGLSVADPLTDFLKSSASGPSWDVTADLCAEIAAMAESRSTPVLFVFVPTHFQVAPTLFDQYVAGFGIDAEDYDLDQPNRILTTKFRDRGLSVIDPLPQFRAAHDLGIALNGRVDRHLTPAGHDQLARIIAPIADSLTRHVP